jgi:hypothetical protein
MNFGLNDSITFLFNTTMFNYRASNKPNDVKLIAAAKAKHICERTLKDDHTRGLTLKNKEQRFSLSKTMRNLMAD